MTIRRYLSLLLFAVAAVFVAPPARAHAQTAVDTSSLGRALHPQHQMIGQLERPTISAESTLQLRLPPPPMRSSNPVNLQAIMIAIAGFGLIGAMRVVSADKDSKFTTDTSRQAANAGALDTYYFFLNRPAWQVAAAAVAPPVCARATTASQVKTTATTQLFVGGVVKSLTATDNLWTLTGGNLAIGACRRYLLLWDGTSGTTVVSVQASTDQVLANFASNALALAACRFPPVPTSKTIVGILSIVNITNAFVPGTTLLSAAGVTDTYIDGIDDGAFQSFQVTP